MKVKVLLLTILFLSVILGLLFVRTIIPIWQSVLIGLVSVIILLYILDISKKRTEKIYDIETGYTVINQFKNDKLIKSTMNDSSGTIIYETVYLNEKIVRSRNYDKKGNLDLEQTYYDNGQVHYRKEFTLSGKKITEFDINGKKKKK